MSTTKTTTTTTTSDKSCTKSTTTTTPSLRKNHILQTTTNHIMTRGGGGGGGGCVPTTAACVNNTNHHHHHHHQEDVVVLPIFQFMDLILNTNNSSSSNRRRSNSHSNGFFVTTKQTSTTTTNLQSLMHRGIMTTKTTGRDDDDNNKNNDFVGVVVACITNRIICSALLDRCRQLDQYNTIISNSSSNNSNSHMNNNSNNYINQHHQHVHSISSSSRARSNSLTTSAAAGSTTAVGASSSSSISSSSSVSSFLRRVLSIQSNAGKYTPLHTAVYQQDIKMILYLLHEIQTSIEYNNEHNISSTTTATATATTNHNIGKTIHSSTFMTTSKSHHLNFQKSNVPLKQLVGMLLRQREAFFHTTTTSNSSSSSSSCNSLHDFLFQLRDADGYTPGALLVQTQRETLRHCRHAMRNTFTQVQQHKQQQVRKKPSIRSSNLFVTTATTTPCTTTTTPSDCTRNRRRRLQSYDRTTVVQQQQQHDDDEEEVDDPDSFPHLSTALRQLAIIQRKEEDEDDEDETGDDDDDDDSHSSTSSMEGNLHFNKADHNFMYGCEVLTYGSAHHCVLGVGKVSNSTTISTTSTTSTSSAVVPSATNTAKVRPQRVIEFAQDTCRVNQKGAVQICAATYHTLVLNEKGQVYSFGLGKSGRLGTGSVAPCSVPVQIGGKLQHHIVVAITAAENHSLAVTSDGQIYAWGSNRFGQLGISNQNHNHNASVQNLESNNNNQCVSSCHLSPRRIDELKNVFCIQVAAGLRHSVALDQDGNVYCWGDNSSGQLGVLTTTANSYVNNNSSNSNSSNTPNNGKKIHKVLALCGSDHAVASKKNHNNTNQHYYHHNNKVHVVQISASEHSTLILGHSCVKESSYFTRNVQSTTAVVYHWGHGNHVPSRVRFPVDPTAQVQQQRWMNPHETNDSYNAILARQRPLQPVAISCALYHNVAITDDGKVYTWGLHTNTLGNTKNGSTLSEPQLVVGMLPEKGGGFAVRVSASEHHTAVITDTGDLFTWGESYQHNVLGHPGVRYQPCPKRVTSVHRAVDVAVAKEHTVLLIGTTFPKVPKKQHVPPDGGTMMSSSFNVEGKKNTKTNPISSLQDLLAQKIIDHIDLFNIIPVLAIAEREQHPMLLQYCHEFVRQNLDGVLNLAQTNALDAYWNEQSSEYTGGGGLISTETSINESKDRDQIYHPILMDILLAGTKRNTLGIQRGVITTKKCSDFFSFQTNNFVDFHEWTKACTELSKQDYYCRLLSTCRSHHRDALQFDKKKLTRRLRSNSMTHPSTSTMIIMNSPGGFRNFVGGVNRVTEMCRHFNKEKDMMILNKQMVQDKIILICKEIRTIRKRLTEIMRLENEEETAILANKQSETDRDDHNENAEKDDSTVINTLDDTMIQKLTTLTIEQNRKVARKPALESDLQLLEKTKLMFETKMEELRTQEIIQSKQDIIHSVLDEEEETRKAVENNFLKTINIPAVLLHHKLSGNECASSSTTEPKLVPSIQRFRCSVCSITCPDKNSLELHTSGRKHRNRVTQINETEKKDAAAILMEGKQKQLLLSQSPTTTLNETTPKSKSSVSCPWNGMSSSNRGPNTEKKESYHPTFRLPLPPHPIADTVVSTTPFVAASASVKTPVVAVIQQSNDKKTDTTKSLLQIMEEESSKKNGQLKNVSTPKKGTSIGYKPVIGRVHLKPVPSLSLRVSSPSAATTMQPTNIKSTPWNSSSVTATLPSCMPAVSSKAAAPSLYDFVVAKQASSSAKKETKVPVDKGSLDGGAWKSSAPPKKIEPFLSASPSLPVPTNLLKPPPLSLQEIQRLEEQSKIKQEDHSTYTPDGKNKWYVTRRDRAGSFQEIQTETKKQEEERQLIAEQLKIEKQIYAELAQAAEKKKKTKEAQTLKKKKKQQQSFMETKKLQKQNTILLPNAAVGDDLDTSTTTGTKTKNPNQNSNGNGECKKQVNRTRPKKYGKSHPPVEQNKQQRMNVNN